MLDLHELQILVVISLIFLAFLVGQLIKRFRISFLPESGAAVILGVIYGVVWYFVPWFKNEDSNFDADSFFLVLLPIIIFESGYSVHRARFFVNIGSILTIAVVGTILSAIFVALVLLAAGAAFPTLMNAGAEITGHVSTPIVDALAPSMDAPFAPHNGSYSFLDFMVFGSIVSATDPVATLAIFGSRTVDPTLYSLVFGESMLNDAVAITLFKTLLSFDGPSPETFTAGTFFAMCGQFLLIGLGSFVMGVVLAALNAFILRRTTLRDHPPTEIFFVLGWAYVSYVLSDAIGLSGIVAIFFYGLVSRHYTHYNLSQTSRDGSLWLFTAIKEVAEMSVFCFLGLSILEDLTAYNFFFIFMAILACLISRFLMIAPLSAVLNLKRKGEKRITWKMQAVMWNAGLRGAVAYALSLRLPEHFYGRAVLGTTIHAVVLFTILVHGGLTAPILKWSGLDVAPIVQDEQAPKKKRVHGLWSRIDKQYLIPFLSYPRNVYEDEKDHGEELRSGVSMDNQIQMEEDGQSDPAAFDDNEDLVVDEELEVEDDVPPPSSTNGNGTSHRYTNDDDDGEEELML